MKCSIHRSEKKQGAYLYLAEDKTLNDIPEELRTLLGLCTEVMQLDLSERKKLATQDINAVKNNLATQGYHLQMPPKDQTGVIQYGV